ncbi:Hypothetical predicted protein [Marmota monax]|uniref:C-type lectin domain-containing protein n=1 Tax=Marmota monax TaxID=9995 RepID=A0A5E4CJR0_MARMO|nr:Hypothetical predicted protein [Marmota monax]
MSDFKEARVQQLGPLEKGLMTASATRSWAEGSGFRLTSAFNSLAGRAGMGPRGGRSPGTRFWDRCLGHGHVPLVLQLLCLTVLAGILVAALVQDWGSQVPDGHGVKAGMGSFSSFPGDCLPPPPTSVQGRGRRTCEGPGSMHPFSKVPSSQEQEQELVKQEKVYQELTQLKAAVDGRAHSRHSGQSPGLWSPCFSQAGGDGTRTPGGSWVPGVQGGDSHPDRLCRPCPWDWTFFQGNCYFFSKSQRNWHDSVTACQEVGAQLVVIKSTEEQSFLQQTSDIQGSAWLGLSDLNKEGAWYWVDGSPLSLNLTRYWMPGQPNNRGGQDCVEVRSSGWKDSKCDYKKFWVCKRFAASCSTE